MTKKQNLTQAQLSNVLVARKKRLARKLKNMTTRQKVDYWLNDATIEDIRTSLSITLERSRKRAAEMDAIVKESVRQARRTDNLFQSIDDHKHIAQTGWYDYPGRRFSKSQYDIGMWRKQ